MINNTNSRIDEQLRLVRRANLRRYAFQRMLEATDRMLWRLEELNRDGVARVPKRVRNEVQELGAGMPRRVRDALRDSGHVQDTLDSLFEAQERLFRWRFPEWHDFDPEVEADVAS